MRMRQILGLLLIAGGLALGVYVGLVYCFIGGIAGGIQMIVQHHVQEMPLAWDIARVVVAWPVGWLSGTLVIGAGMELAGIGRGPRRHRDGQ